MLLQKQEEQGLSKSNLANKKLYNVFVLCVVCGVELEAFLCYLNMYSIAYLILCAQRGRVFS